MRHRLDLDVRLVIRLLVFLLVLFREDFLDLLGRLALNHRRDLGTAQMQQGFDVHVVGPEDDLEDGTFGHPVDKVGIPFILDNLLHFDRSDGLGDFCGDLALVVFKIINNEFEDIL